LTVARPIEVDKKHALAREAVAVLEKRGLETSMAELADALGVKRPTLLYHFPTKADIVALALVELLTEQAAYVLAEIEKHEHPIDRLLAQLRAVHAFHHGREARVVFLTQAIAASAGERLGELMALGNAVFAAQRSAQVERLRAGIEAGLVAPCDPEALVATVRALIDGLMVQRVMEGRALEPVHLLVAERLLLPLKRGRRRANPPEPRAAAGARPRAPQPRRARRARASS
jgi:AcrR family transcriptional regulator